jgi:ABC-type uncharacterized transport system substrate-binding protein
VLILLLAVAIKAEAQQSPKVPRIGILEPSTSASISARIEAFRQGLRELRYVEGKNITIEYRYADGKSERIPDLAAELVSLKVDLIVTSQTPTVLAKESLLNNTDCLLFSQLSGSRMGSSIASRGPVGMLQA